MGTSGRTAIMLLLAGGLLVGSTGGALGQAESEPPSPSPEPTLSVSPLASPLEPEAGASTYTLEGLTAPVEEPPSPGAVLGMYEPIGSESLVVIDFSVKTPDFSTPDGVEMETAILTETGYAAHLCAKGSLGETAREKALEQQRGCLLAIAGEWVRHLEAETPEEAAAHYDAARAVFSLASATLDRKSLEWLVSTLLDQLPATSDEIARFDPDAKVGKAKVKSLLARQSRTSGGTALLRAIRDAHATDLPFALEFTDWVWSVSGRPSSVGWQVVNAKNGKVHHATRAGMCIHDLRYLEKEKWPINLSGTSFVMEPAYACWDLTRQMWEAYRATGSDEYRAAAEQAWAMLRKTAPADADRVAKTGRWGKYERPLR